MLHDAMHEWAALKAGMSSVMYDALQAARQAALYQQSVQGDSGYWRALTSASSRSRVSDVSPGGSCSRDRDLQACILYPDAPPCQNNGLIAPQGFANVHVLAQHHNPRARQAL